MINKLIPAFAIVVLLASCSSMKPLNSSSNKQVNSTPATTDNKGVKFLDDISVNPQSTTVKTSSVDAAGNKNRPVSDIDLYTSRNTSIENATPVQLKYAVLLNTEVEQLDNTRLLESVDEWYGTRYRMGGTTKKGIDCSAFVQAVYLSAFALTLP